jgi:Tfp pilus assembly protein PilN
MRVRTKTALGIDIGDHGVSIALVEKGEQGFRTLAAARGDLPAGEPGQRQSALDKVLSGLLVQLGRRVRIRGMKAAVALSADPLVMQLLDLPQHVPANLGEFVKNELQQYVALSGKTLVSDFCGVGSGGQKRLLAAAADADRIQEMVKVCSVTGIVVDTVEPSMLAYARAFQECPREAWHGGDVTIAMLGPRTLTICLFRRGTLDFVRARSLPADVPTPRLLCTWLAEELRAVVRYGDIVGWGLPHRDPGGGASPTLQCRVVIHDGVHRADEIAPLLAAEAGTRSLTVTDAWEPWTGSGSEPPEGVSRVAVGAALTLLGTKENDLKINLLPKTVTEARSLSRHLLLTANVCVIAFLGVFATAQLLARTTGAMDRRIEQTRLSGELYTTPALITEEKFLDQEISRIRQRLDPLRKAMNGRHGLDWPGILHAVRQATPANLSITQLQCSDGRTLSLKGLASSCPAAEAFVRNLEGQRPFESISLALVQRQQNGSDGLEYRIDCLLKGPPNAARRVWEPKAKGGKPS